MHLTAACRKLEKANGSTPLLWLAVDALMLRHDPLWVHCRIDEYRLADEPSGYILNLLLICTGVTVPANHKVGCSLSIAHIQAFFSQEVSYKFFFYVVIDWILESYLSPLHWSAWFMLVASLTRLHRGHYSLSAFSHDRHCRQRWSLQVFFLLSWPFRWDVKR